LINRLSPEDLNINRKTIYPNPDCPLGHKYVRNIFLLILMPYGQTELNISVLFAGYIILAKRNNLVAVKNYEVVLFSKRLTI